MIFVSALFLGLASLGGHTALAAPSGDFFYTNSSGHRCFIHKLGANQYEAGEIKSDGTRMVWENAITGSKVQSLKQIETQLSLEADAINMRNFAKRDVAMEHDADLVGDFENWEHPGHPAGKSESDDLKNAVTAATQSPERVRAALRHPGSLEQQPALADELTKSPPESNVETELDDMASEMRTHSAARGN